MTNLERVKILEAVYNNALKLRNILDSNYSLLTLDPVLEKLALKSECINKDVQKLIDKLESYAIDVND